jgi:hypothetical protein
VEYKTAGVGVQTTIDGGIAFTTYGGRLNLASGLGDFQAGVLSGAGTINGNDTQTPGGVLNIDVGGPNLDTDYSQVVVSSTATLGGALNVGSRSGSTFATTNVDPSFLPPIHDPIDVTLKAM